MYDSIVSIYKQAFEEERMVTVPNSHILKGYTQIDCQECCGTGLYKLPDDKDIICGACKGGGKEWVSL